MSLVDVAKKFRDAFHYDPGHSDLDNEQPITITVTLGDWRELHHAIYVAIGLHPEDIRTAALEEAALVLDRMAAAMAAHTNPDGIVTGEDFFDPEIIYVRQAAIDIRALKQSSPQKL